MFWRGYLLPLLKPVILRKIKQATLRRSMSFYLLLMVQYCWSTAMAVSQAGVVLCNCGWVCHIHRRQTCISPQFVYYIHSLPTAKVVPRNFRFITNSTKSSFFSWKFRFLFMPTYSTPGDNIYYTVRYGADSTAVKEFTLNIRVSSFY